MLCTKPLILVVDDESDTLGFLFSLLESEGYRVATTNDPFDALRYVAREKPEVVITDLRMPEMEGLELLAKVKRISPATRVVVMSAYGDWSTYFDTLDLGGDDLIGKPYRPAEMLRTVERALQIRG